MSTTVGESVHRHLTKELVQYFNNASYFKENDNSDKSVRKWVLTAHKTQVRIWLVMPAKVKETNLYRLGKFLQLQHIFYKGKTGLTLIFIHFLLPSFLFKTDNFLQPFSTPIMDSILYFELVSKYLANCRYLEVENPKHISRQISKLQQLPEAEGLALEALHIINQPQILMK